MKYFYYPYVRVGNVYKRLPYAMEEVPAEHKIRQHASTQFNCREPFKFVNGTINFWDTKKNIRVGFIKKEIVQECRMKNKWLK